MAQVSQIQGRVAVARAEAEGQRILSGDLGDISLPTLLQLVQIETISGWMTIDNHARIDVSRGHLVGARIGALTGVEALREILFQEGGTFQVLRGEPEGGDAIECVPFAVMDACRLRDEWDRIAGKILRMSGDHTWKATGTAVDAVMAAVDGERSIHEISVDLGQPPTLIVDGILDAMAMGLVSVAGSKPVDASLPAHVTLVEEALDGGDIFDEEDGEEIDFYELLDRARTLLRSGELDAAETAVRRALRERPDDRVARQNLRAIQAKRART
ncbi:MAG: DUF4388 domain-containing protein [Nannocystaceae bacterium]